MQASKMHKCRILYSVQRATPYDSRDNASHGIYSNVVLSNQSKAKALHRRYKIMATTNSSRIEAATRLYVGKRLTGEQIKFAVRQMFPDETPACYPSDCAFTLKADGTLQPRTNTQHTDKSERVLAYKGTDAFLVMPTDKIYR